MVAPKAVQRLPRAVAAAARQTAATSAVWLRHRVACAATLLTLFLWLGLLHTNAAVALLALLFLPSPAAVAALAGLLVLGLLPVRRPFRRWQRRLAHHICLVAHAYFPISLACSPAAEAAFASGGLFVVGLEPHSVLPVGLVAFHPGAPGLPPSLDGLKRAALASSTLFRVPLVKHMWSWLGLQAVDRRNCRRLLHSGHSLVLVPGGVRECLHLAHGTETVFLRKRFGFVKLSIQHGAWVFGVQPCSLPIAPTTPPSLFQR